MTLTWRILTGDVRETLKSLPDGCVQTCVTSPPYWGLRDYGHTGQIGLEPTPYAYVANLVAVFSDVRRVLRDDGTVWLNLGDSYSTSPGFRPEHQATSTLGPKRDGLKPDNAAFILKPHRPRVESLKPKDLVGIPWRVAFALQADGWYLRSDIIWSKPNPMPESVTDRPTKAHEYLFLLSKRASYYYDAEAIKEQGVIEAGTLGAKGSAERFGLAGVNSRPPEYKVYDGTRNKRSVWHVATQPYAGAHFATFPEALIEPCILAGSRLGDTVLDPFTGSGTTGAVAIRNGRNFIGCELNPAYVELAEKRIGAVAPLFAERTA